MLATPRTLEEVTTAWLADALGVELDDVHLERIGTGEGFMGQLARATLHHSGSTDPAVPATVIVKLPTADPGGQFIGQMMRVWEREHCFYRDIAPNMRIRVPQALVNIAEPPCLVLEDLAPAVQGDHVAGATLDQAQRAIDTIAIHHASWFEHPSLAGFEWLPGLDDPQVDALGPMFTMGWPGFLERFGDRVPTRVLRWCEQFVVGIPEWIGTHMHEPVTLTHGDFRLDNLFFADDGSVAVIDWQLSMRAPGQADLVYFCANNLTVEMRRSHEDALIERYVTGLHAAGVPADAVTLEEVRHGYLEGLLFYAVTFASGLLGIDPANERGIALFDSLVMRTFTAVDDLAVGVVLGLDE